MALCPDEKGNLINGEWTPAARSIANINPSDTSDIVGTYARATAAEVDSAVVAAAVAQKSWRNSTPQARADILDHVGTALLSQSAEIGRLLSRKEGKTLVEGIGEVTRAGQIFKYYAQEALRISGDVLSLLRPGVDVERLANQ